MKKKIIILTALLFSTGISAQETLTLEQCREMALKYNKEMALRPNRRKAHATPQRVTKATSCQTSPSAEQVFTVRQTAV